MHIVTVLCLVEFLLFAGMFTFGLKRYNKTAWLFSFAASLNAILVSFFVANENPPMYIGGSRLLTKLAVEYTTLCGVCGVIACVAISLWWAWKQRQASHQVPKSGSFRYKYMRHHFDVSQQHFFVEAKNQQEADVLAADKMARLLKAGHTKMKTCDPA